MAVCVSGYSQHPVVAEAVGEVVGDVLARMDPHPDIVVLLASGRYAAALGEVVPAVRTLLAPQVLIGSDVPQVYGGSDERSSADGLLLFASHLDTEEPVIPVRYDPAGQEAAWRTGDGSPIAADGVCLTLTEPAYVSVDPPGRVIGAACSLGSGLILDGAGSLDGGVGIRFPPSAVEPFDAVLPVWEDVAITAWDDEAGAHVTEHTVRLRGQPFDPGPGTGLLVFAARGAGSPMSQQSAMEIVFDRYGGAVAGALAPAVRSPGNPVPAADRDRSICGLIVP